MNKLLPRMLQPLMN